MLRQLPVRWLDTVGDRTLALAGRFKAEHHLSLAHCSIAAFAAEEGTVLVHKDPEYDAWTAVREERLPQKTQP